jgi:hypothetical protein
VWHLDNPAGRLHALLSDLRHRNPISPLGSAWSIVFQVSERDTAEMLRRLAQVLALPNRAIAALRTTDQTLVDHEMLSRWYTPVTQMLTASVQLDQPLTQILGLLSEVTMFSLEACNDTLHRHLPESTITADDLARIDPLLKELRAFEGGEFGNDLDDFLLSMIAMITRGFDDYPIRGIDALNDAFDLTAGLVRRRDDLASKAAANHPELWKTASTVWQEWFSWTQR